jgi:hypothetical protein
MNTRYIKFNRFFNFEFFFCVKRSLISKKRRKQDFYRAIWKNNKSLRKCHILSRVQMKSWAGKALETVNCCAFLKRRLIGACC